MSFDGKLNVSASAIRYSALFCLSECYDASVRIAAQQSETSRRVHLHSDINAVRAHESNCP